MTGRQRIAGRMGRVGLVGLVGLVMLTLTASAQVKERAEVLLQAAIKQELVEGDLKGAIAQFKKIAQNSSPDVAAQALLHMAACYDKLGQGEARSTYENVVLQYPTQKKAVAEARAWLDAHGGNGSTQAGRSVQQIWSGRFLNLEGPPSADGRYVAFVEWKDGTGNLAVRDLRTGENRLLTHDGTAADFTENPILSPDGKQIAYRFGEKDSTIRLINSDGSRMRALAHDGHTNYLIAWSPDGRFIAATHDNGDQTQGIVLISTSNGSVTQLKSIPSRGATLGGFSPDGRFLVYAIDKNPKDPAAGNGGVFLLATDATRVVPLVQGSAAQGPAVFKAPVWSPDGRRIIFTSDRSGSVGLWAVKVANERPDGDPQLIQANTGSMRPMGFSGDGAFYYGTQETQVEAYTAELDPDTLAVGRPVPVTDRSVGSNRSPELSPDGKSAAFLRRAGGPPLELVIRSLATGEERTLTTLTAVYGARTLQWFPDSRSVLVTDSVERRKRFRQVNIESGGARVLFEGPWEVWIGALSADGTALFYSIKEQGTLRLVKRRLETGEETELYRKDSDGTGLFGLAASPDGTRVAFSRNVEDNKRALMIMPVDGGTPREIYRSGYDDLTPQGAMAWTKDGRHIVFSGKCGPSEDEQLCAISTEGGGLKPLGLSMQTIPSRMISADGRRIAFTGATGKQELWVIRNLLSEPAKAR